MAKVLCWPQSWETWASVFTTLLMLDKLLSLSVPAFSSLFYLSQCRESNGWESIQSIKCYLNMGIIVTKGEIRYQKTRQADLVTSYSKLEVSNSQSIGQRYALFGPHCV